MKYAKILLSAALMTLPIAALARGPAYSAPGADHATLRFSWRMSVPARENCRVRSQEELEALPVHMRAPEECTPDLSDFILVLAVDGRAADTIPIVRGGLKGDRPLTVLQDRRLPPGQHGIDMQFLRVAHDGTTVIAALDTTLHIAPGAVGLVTLDANAGRLHARTPRSR